VVHQQAVSILKQQVQYQDSIKIRCARLLKKHKIGHVKAQLKKQIQPVQGSQHILKLDWQLAHHN